MCIVTVSGGEVKKHVFGAGKGEQENSFECERAMVYRTSVIVKNGKVDGNVYGGGEIGRVENNTAVIVGLDKVADGTTTYYTKSGTDTYTGSVPTAGTSVVDKYIQSGVEGSYVYTLIGETSAPSLRTRRVPPRLWVACSVPVPVWIRMATRRWCVTTVLLPSRAVPRSGRVSMAAAR